MVVPEPPLLLVPLPPAFEPGSAGSVGRSVGASVGASVGQAANDSEHKQHQESEITTASAAPRVRATRCARMHASPSHKHSHHSQPASIHVYPSSCRVIMSSAWPTPSEHQTERPNRTTKQQAASRVRDHDTTASAAPRVRRGVRACMRAQATTTTHRLHPYMYIHHRAEWQAGISK